MYDFSINGTLDTGQNCLSNLQKLCTAAGSWVTYDIAAGKWSFTIKEAGSSVFDFNDSNIIGNISVSSTGITDLYNKCTISYPHKDLQDKTDQIDMEIPTVNRYKDEIDNTLNIQTDLINDPIQAKFMATVELKQNRLDTVIKFTTEYTAITLKAGDIISVTNEIYGFDHKLFRILSIQEDDTDVIQVTISASEYSADVYDPAGLIYTKRDVKTGIVPKSANSVLAAQDNAAIGNAALAGIDSDPVAMNNLLDMLTKAGSSVIFYASSYMITNAPMTASSNIADMYVFLEETFSPKTTGLNIFKISWNIENAVCNGSRGPVFNEQTDFIQVGVTISDLQTGTDLGGVVSGGMGAQGWVDLTTDISMDLVAGKQYGIRFGYVYYSPEKAAINNAAVPPVPNTLTLGVSYFGFGFIPQATDSSGSNAPSLMKSVPDFAAIRCSYPAPGKDFDFKVRIVSPECGMITGLGINGDVNSGNGFAFTQYPETGTPYIIWGGDDANESPSFECVAANIVKLKQDYPYTTKFIFELRGIWGTTTTPPYWHPSAPLMIESILWSGGTVVPDGKNFVNPTADTSLYIRAGAVGTNAHYTKDPYGSEQGPVLGYFVVDIDKQITYFTSTLA